MPGGKLLERRINKCNRLYRRNKLAAILKIEVPIRVTNKGMIPSLSTVDYSGVISPIGTFVAFDAKECGSKTSFPLQDIRQHQIEYLQLVEELGGRAFFLIHMYNLDQNIAYKVPASFIYEFWKRALDGGRKSIPISEFKKEWRVNIDNYLEL